MAQPNVTSSKVNINSQSFNSLSSTPPPPPGPPLSAEPPPPGQPQASSLPQRIPPHIVRAHSTKNIPIPTNPTNFYYTQNIKSMNTHIDNSCHSHTSSRVFSPRHYSRPNDTNNSRTASPYFPPASSPAQQVPYAPQSSPNQQPLSSTWSTQYIQQQRQRQTSQPQAIPQQFQTNPQQYSAQYYYNNNKNWSMPQQHKFYNASQQSTYNVYNSNNSNSSFAWLPLPPPPPPPVFPEDNNKKEKKVQWKPIAASDQDSPSLSSSSCLTDITEGDYDDLKLTPMRMEPKHVDKDRLIGILQKLPGTETSLGTNLTEPLEPEPEHSKHTMISRLSSFSRKPEMEDEEEAKQQDEEPSYHASLPSFAPSRPKTVPLVEDREMDVLSSPEIEIYDDMDSPYPSDDTEKMMEGTTGTQAMELNHKSCSAPWETSDDETTAENTPNKHLKNSVLLNNLGLKKLSITIKDAESILNTVLSENEGEMDEDPQEEEEYDSLFIHDSKNPSQDSVVIHSDETPEPPEPVAAAAHDEMVKKREIEEYEEYIKKHNKKRKKDKKKKKKKQHKSPIFIEESMCYDLWDLHEMHELAVEKIRQEEERERQAEYERWKEAEEYNQYMEDRQQATPAKKKRKKKKSKEKKKLFKKKSDRQVMSPKERKRHKEAMNLSKTGFRVRVNRRYRLDDGRIGICKFRGRTVFGKSGEDWIGLMVEYGKGEHNGKVEGKKYFACKNGKGIMVRPQKVIQDLGLPRNEALDARTIYNTKDINHLLLHRQRSAVSMYD